MKKIFQIFLTAEKPGQSKFTTRDAARKILSRFSRNLLKANDRTPISLLVRNKDQRSRDYGKHCFYVSSGACGLSFYGKIRHPRLQRRRAFFRSGNTGRVAAGAIASKNLKRTRNFLCAYTKAPRSHYVINETEYNYSRSARTVFICQTTISPSRLTVHYFFNERN